MGNPCYDCWKSEKCEKMCLYKVDYIRHRKKTQPHLYDFRVFLKWIDEQRKEMIREQGGKVV